MRGSCPRAGAIGAEAVAGKRGSFHATAQIAVGRAESRSKAREGCAWRPLPINRHLVRRVAEAVSRLFVAPGGTWFKRGEPARPPRWAEPEKGWTGVRTPTGPLGSYGSF